MSLTCSRIRGRVPPADDPLTDRSFHVMMSSLYFVTFLLMLLKPLSAYYLTIDAHAEECFFDRVTTGTKMGLTFEVIDGGFYDIDVKITG